MKRSVLLPLVAVLVTSCGSTQAVPKTKTELGRYSNAEVMKLADANLAKLKLTDKERGKITAALKAYMKQKNIVKKIERGGVNGVIAYQAASGGFLFATGDGKGYASFKGGSEVRFKASGTKIGAVAGGKNSWGVALVIGLKYQEGFGGKYAGSVSGAAAGDASVGKAVLNRKDDPGPDYDHNIYVISRSAGLMADATFGECYITVLGK